MIAFLGEVIEFDVYIDIVSIAYIFYEESLSWCDKMAKE